VKGSRFDTIDPARGRAGARAAATDSALVGNGRVRRQRLRHDDNDKDDRVAAYFNSWLQRHTLGTSCTLFYLFGKPLCAA
jgi:hypothetical protein